MTWSTPIEYRLGCGEMEWCQHHGCIFGAVVRFTSTLDAVDRRDKRIRTTTRCEIHAEVLRAELANRVVVLPPPVAVEQPDESRRFRAVVPLEQPKRPPLKWPIPPGEPAMCSSCAAKVFWIITQKGKRMPIDAEGEHRGESHFATCRFADEHRRKRA